MLLLLPRIWCVTWIRLKHVCLMWLLCRMQLVSLQWGMNWTLSTTNQPNIHVHIVSDEAIMDMLVAQPQEQSFRLHSWDLM